MALIQKMFIRIEKCWSVALFRFNSMETELLESAKSVKSAGKIQCDLLWCISFDSLVDFRETDWIFNPFSEFVIRISKPN